ncbi:16170_t:CDS:2, partial [Funneliformis mosseae]
CNEIIKSRRCDKAKDIRAAKFDIFAVCEAVLNPNHPKISIGDNFLRKRFDIYLKSSDTTKSIIIEELGFYHETDNNSIIEDDKGNDHQSNYGEFNISGED